MKDEEILYWLKTYEARLKSPDQREPILLTHEWTQRFPASAGVYAVFDSNNLVYVGETGSIQARMNDIRHTQHHTLRRNVGARNFVDVPGYEKASSLKKYTPHIEELVEEFLRRLEVKALAISFGRKEIEEHLVGKFGPVYNSKGKRSGRS